MIREAPFSSQLTLAFISARRMSATDHQRQFPITTLRATQSYVAPLPKYIYLTNGCQDAQADRGIPWLYAIDSACQEGIDFANTYSRPPAIVASGTAFVV
ncbi:hypothetical protein BDZ89DRAFT_244852 [Hymenopellis radicata]|nr:hypothetical protein BDZ89DRAFT_244852 [Hymenopellis radicata]